MSGNRPPSRLEPLDKGFYSDMLNPNQLQNNENEEDPPETIKNLQVSIVLVKNAKNESFLMKSG